MTDPWLSVVIPTFNGQRYLRETFESIAAQDVRGFECVVVDGGSTDATREIIGEFQRELEMRVLIRSEFPNWVGKTNTGFREARARFVCMLHHDDCWLPGRTRAIRDALEHYPDVALVLHPSRLIDENGRTIGTWRCPLDPLPRVYSPAEVLERLIVQNFISVPSPTFRRETALTVGGIDDALWYTGDWDFYLKIARTGRTVYLDAELSAFRIHSSSLTTTGSADLDDFRHQLDTVLERHLDSIQPPSRRATVRRVAEASNAVNTALAGAARGSWSRMPGALVRVAALGPQGWRNYVENSRITERLWSRLRARRRLSRTHTSPFNEPQPKT